MDSPLGSEQERRSNHEHGIIRAEEIHFVGTANGRDKIGLGIFFTRMKVRNQNTTIKFCLPDCPTMLRDPRSSDLPASGRTNGSKIPRTPHMSEHDRMVAGSSLKANTLTGSRRDDSQEAVVPSRLMHMTVHS